MEWMKEARLHGARCSKLQPGRPQRTVTHLPDSGRQAHRIGEPGLAGTGWTARFNNRASEQSWRDRQLGWLCVGARDRQVASIDEARCSNTQCPNSWIAVRTCRNRSQGHPAAPVQQWAGVFVGAQPVCAAGGDTLCSLHAGLRRRRGLDVGSQTWEAVGADAEARQRAARMQGWARKLSNQYVVAS